MIIDSMTLAEAKSYKELQHIDTVIEQYHAEKQG